MPTILVADDNSNIQKMVSLVFKEKGITVVAVGNGEAACRKVPEVHPDVVLADVFMPVRNGYEVCEFVKQDPQFAETPVILLVGAFDPLDEKEAQRVGANGVLKKPFVPPEPLITLVSSLLGKSESTTGESPSSIPAPAPEPFRAPVRPAPREFSAVPEPSSYGETDETATSFGEPVAIPASESKETEEDPEPASEWARKRASMDYEIDAADSANMVERLAAEGAREEPEIQPANKHLPFGGANIPGTLSESSVEATPAAWSEPELEVSGEPASSAAGSAEGVEEFSLSSTPVTNDEEILIDVAETSAPNYGPADAEPAEPFLRVPPPKELENIPEPAKTHAAAEEPAQNALADSPEIDIVQPAPEVEKQPSSKFFKPFSWTKAKSPIFEAPPAKSLPIDEPAAVPAISAEPEAMLEEAAPNAASKADAEAAPPNAPVDQATVDDVVAKVISKLEPQLHQALANGVLRPLVEELLNQQREKK